MDETAAPVRDDWMTVFLSIAGVLGLGLAVLLIFFVGPGTSEKADQHQACLDKNGIWIDSSRDCLKRGVSIYVEEK